MLSEDNESTAEVIRYKMRWGYDNIRASDNTKGGCLYIFLQYSPEENEENNEILGQYNG